MQGRVWTQDELVKALALYYQIPFGKIHHGNPAIIALARHLERTPSSVALKLVNFASLDPTITSTGRRGMRNSSREDRRVFAEFGDRWETLAGVLPDEIELAMPVTREISITPRDHLSHLTPGQTESPRVVSVRRGQQFFRNAVLAAYGGRCCITSLAVSTLLRASHIIPWSKDASARLDPTNGLCLSALFDAAFDSGLLTIDEEYKVVFARSLRDAVGTDIWNRWFAPYESKQIHKPERLQPRDDALRYHRDSIFSP